MAVETYKWPVQLGGGAIEYAQAIRSAQFGDGYEQVAENGINCVVANSVRKNLISSNAAELTFTIKRAYGVYA
ncbi:MAG: hypothetical protein K0S90_75 [Enterobacteriaceae bacterium]|nr:hypothetical protein [Enterobacteriaceae bacterium]